MAFRARRLLLPLLLIPVSVIAFAFYLYRYHPVTTFEWKTRAELKWGGWRWFEIDGFTGLEQNFCKEQEPCEHVALIHGFCDNLATWRAMLEKGQAAWAGRHVMVFDLPGAGSTPLPRSKSEIGVRLVAQRLNRALEKRAARWIVVGNSLGGWIAAWMAIEKAELIERLVLLSPAGMPRQSEAAFQKFLHPTPTSIKKFMRLAYAKPLPIPEFAWADIVQSFKSCQDLGLTWNEARGESLETRLSQIKVPTTILWGKGDRLIDISAGEAMAAGIPQASLIKVPHCGHLPQRECPAAVFSAIDHGR